MIKRKKEEQKENKPLALRLPGILKEHVDRDAREHEVTNQKVIIRLIAKHYNILIY